MKTMFIRHHAASRYEAWFQGSFVTEVHLSVKEAELLAGVHQQGAPQDRVANLRERLNAYKRKALRKEKELEQKFIREFEEAEALYRKRHPETYAQGIPQTR